MYSNDKGFGLKDLIIKIVFLVLFVLLMVWLFRTNIPNMTPFYSNQFRENISYMQDAAKSYFTTDKLPTEIGKTTKLTLKEMQEMNLIIPFVDKDGNSCNIYESYAEVTKEENGYSLKVNLSCSTETDYIIEILGCYDYGCDDGCTIETKETAIEYEFTRTTSKKITDYSCPDGYTKDGKYCYKTSGSETIAATKNYSKITVLQLGVLYTIGENQKVEVDSVCKDSTSNSRTTIASTTKTSTTGSCTDVRVKDPNCSVQCETKYVNGEYVPVCNTCGYVTRQDCSGVKTTTTETCPSTADGYYYENGKLVCYILNPTTTTSCSCPAEATSSTGSGTSLRCYKTIEGDKTPYCENEDAVYDATTNKCLLQTGGSFTNYSCPSGYDLDEENGTCSKTTTEKIKATAKTYTKKSTQTKWSRSKTLLGWTATGRTRIVEVE